MMKTSKNNTNDCFKNCGMRYLNMEKELEIKEKIILEVKCRRGIRQNNACYLLMPPKWNNFKQRNIYFTVCTRQKLCMCIVSQLPLAQGLSQGWNEDVILSHHLKAWYERVSFQAYSCIFCRLQVLSGSWLDTNSLLGVPFQVNKWESEGRAQKMETTVFFIT